jgi:hypothetical protein
MIGFLAKTVYRHDFIAFSHFTLFVKLIAKMVFNAAVISVERIYFIDCCLFRISKRTPFLCFRMLFFIIDC